MAEKKKTTAKTKTPAKKTTAKSKTAAKKKEEINYVGSEKKGRKNEWSGNKQYVYTIAFIATSVLFICIAFINGEKLWAWLRGIFFSMFGVGFFMITFFMLCSAVIVSVKKIKKNPMILLTATTILTLLVISLVHVIMNSGSGTQTLLEQLKVSASLGWNISTQGFQISGGILGTAIGGGLMFLFGKAPAIAIILILIFVNILLLMVAILDLFGMSLRETYLNQSDKHKEKMIEKKAERELILEEKREQKKLDKEEAAARRQKEIEERELREEQRRKEAEQRVRARHEQESRQTEQEKTYESLSQSDIDKILAGSAASSVIKPIHTESTSGIFTIPVDNSDTVPLSTAAASHPIQLTREPKKEIKAENNIHEVSQTIEHDDTALQQNAIVEAARREANEKAAKAQTAVDEYKQEKTRNRQSYKKPPIDCLAAPKLQQNTDSTEEINATAQKLISTLKSFNVETTLTGMSIGPSVTRYEVSPAPGVKISKITSLADDIALSLAASGVRIEAPIPNKSAVGIEVPNKVRSMVTLREIISSPEFKNASSKLNVALGKDITGAIHCADLVKMPHLLIAGTTGSGKSVCLNGMIASILYNAGPDEVKMILIDPKQVEFMIYNGIPHLLVPVISNARKAAAALAWAVGEMENRYKAFTECGVRDISGFNKYVASHPDDGLASMPKIVIFIDELNDLMMISPKDVEDSICRLAQKARAAGMHLVVATQRPSVDVITGIIKANIPSRISLSVSSQIDSRTILDAIGAEKLLGNGDMLYNPVGISKPVRIQGAFLSDEEVENIVDYLKAQETVEYDNDIMDEIERQAAAAAEGGKKKGAAQNDETDEPEDEMFDAAVECIINGQQASTTYLQKRLKLGYARASRLMDTLFEKGYVSAQDGSKPRKVLITAQQWAEIKSGSAAAIPVDSGEQLDFDIFADDE